jgi:BNR repeat-containing family member
MTRLALLGALVLMLFAPSVSLAGQVSPGGGSFVDLGSGAWCWFQDPRALYLEGHTYAGWMNRTGYVVIADVTALATTIVPIAHLGSSAYHDDHDAPALLVEPDGRLTVFYSAHSGPQMYSRTTLEPDEITSWGPQETTPANPKGEGTFTYPNPVYLSAQQETYLFWRGEEQPTFAQRGVDGHWSQSSVLINEPSGVPYMKVASNGRDTIYFAFTDGHPRNRVTSIYFAEYREGMLRRADGSVIAPLGSAPIRPGQADRVYDAEANHGIRSWVDDVAVLPDGSPVILYTTFPDSARWREYHYAQWDGHGWLTHDIGLGGATITPVHPERFYSGGMTLDHGDPRLLYASVGSFAHHRIERLFTGDGGRSWQRRWITSAESDNIRPVVPRGLPPGREEVLWMRGNYDLWQAPKTSIVGLGLK